MGLKKCPDCGSEISTEAVACPKCGRPTVKTKKSPLASGCGFIILVFIIIGVLASLFDKSGSTTSSGSSTGSTVSDAPVNMNDASALDTKYGTDAIVYCASNADDYLRQIAKYDFRWDDVGFLDSKFDKYLEKVSAPGVLTLASSKAKLQNGFGAYEHIDLRCDYDTQAKKVIRYWVRR